MRLKVSRIGKVLLFLGALAASAHVASARLGESLEQMKARFGEPQPGVKSLKLADGRELKIYVFKKEGVPFAVSAAFLNGTVIMETYTRPIAIGIADVEAALSGPNGTADTTKGKDIPALASLKSRILWPEMRLQLTAVLEANSQGKTWTLAPFPGLPETDFKKADKGDQGLETKCQFSSRLGLCKAWRREDGGICRFLLTRLPDWAATTDDAPVTPADVQAFITSNPSVVVVAATAEGEAIDKQAAREQANQSEQEKKTKAAQKVGI